MRIESESIGSVKITLLREKNPKTVDRLSNKLPLEGKARTWGDEVYFSVGVDIEEENAQEVLEEGPVAFWPSGNAVCIFFGPTPASTDERPKAAGPVNVFGRVSASALNRFEKVETGEQMKLVK